MAFHFFTDLNNLNNQVEGEEFGYTNTVGNIDSFRVSSRHTASGIANAYAIADGMISIQPTSSSDKVNIILKPVRGPHNSLLSEVEFVVYRNVEASSVLTGTQIKSFQDGDSDLVKKVQDSLDNMIEKGSEITSINRDLLGFSATETDFPTLLSLFNEGLGITQIVNKGNSLGTFDQSDFGLDLLSNTFHYRHRLSDVRESDNLLSAESINTPFQPLLVTDAKSMYQRSKILAYLDPVLLWGSFYYCGVRYSNQDDNNTVKRDEINQEILPKYLNKGKIFVDIRNKEGYPYCSFGEFQDSNLQIGFNDMDSLLNKNYLETGWPLLILSGTDYSSLTESNKKLKLRIKMSKPLYNVKRMRVLLHRGSFDAGGVNRRVREHENKVKIQVCNYIDDADFSTEKTFAIIDSNSESNISPITNIVRISLCSNGRIVFGNSRTNFNRIDGLFDFSNAILPNKSVIENNQATYTFISNVPLVTTNKRSANVYGLFNTVVSRDNHRVTFTFYPETIESHEGKLQKFPFTTFSSKENLGFLEYLKKYVNVSFIGGKNLIGPDGVEFFRPEIPFIQKGVGADSNFDLITNLTISVAEYLSILNSYTNNLDTAASPPTESLISDLYSWLSFDLKESKTIESEIRSKYEIILNGFSNDVGNLKSLKILTGIYLYN